MKLLNSLKDRLELPSLIGELVDIVKVSTARSASISVMGTTTCGGPVFSEFFEDNNFGNSSFGSCPKSPSLSISA